MKKVDKFGRFILRLEGIDENETQRPTILRFRISKSQIARTSAPKKLILWLKKETFLLVGVSDHIIIFDFEKYGLR